MNDKFIIVLPRRQARGHERAKTVNNIAPASTIIQTLESQRKRAEADNKRLAETMYQLCDLHEARRAGDATGAADRSRGPR